MFSLIGNEMSRFHTLTTLSPTDAFALNKSYREDTFENKVNLGIGAYMTEQAEPWVLPCVKKVEAALGDDINLNYEYLPILGFDPFCKEAVALALGRNNPATMNGRTFGVQTLSGTGALRLAAEFLRKNLGYPTYFYSDPSWENHGLIFKHAGFLFPHKYRYCDEKNKGIEFDGLIEDLKGANQNAVIIFHACAHNPTGYDPTQDQWKEIAEVVKRRNLFPVFDMAYQGLASGDPEKDVWPVRYFVILGIELLICQSFSKNFGLYNEGVGNLIFVVNSPEVIAPIKIEVSKIIQAMYSNPPNNHGARIVATILGNAEYNKEWRDCLKKMYDRIREMRALLKAKLDALGTPGSWDHITSQTGMFTFTGLKIKQVEHLIKKYHIYLLHSGHINVSGLNKNNIDYVANAIHETAQGAS